MKHYKVGILTFHWAPNAGAVLQAYALKAYLTQKGYNADIINYTPQYKRWGIRDFVAKNLKNLLYKLKNIYYYLKYLNNYNSILKLSCSKITSKKKLQKELSKYDVAIVGSDQIWNPALPWYNDVYFLNFPNTKIKKISYAASMGQGIVTTLEIEKIRSYLRDFSAISVREHSAQTLLKKVSQREVYVVPDPTLLLSPSDYKKLCTMSNTMEDKYICSYILDAISDIQGNEINDFATVANLKWKNIKNPESGLFLSDYGAIDLVTSPLEWLQSINNSKFVICGSFHVTVFSLIFHKNFVYFEPEEARQQGGNQRVRSLLSDVNLLDRIVHNPTSSDYLKMLRKDIDWEKVDYEINKLKLEGFAFISQALEA